MTESITCITCGHEGDETNKTLLTYYDFNTHHEVAWVCNRWQCIINPNTTYEHTAVKEAYRKVVDAQ